MFALTGLRLACAAIPPYFGESLLQPGHRLCQRLHLRLPPCAFHQPSTRVSTGSVHACSSHLTRLRGPRETGRRIVPARGHEMQCGLAGRICGIDIGARLTAVATALRMRLYRFD